MLPRANETDAQGRARGPGRLGAIGAYSLDLLARRRNSWAYLAFAFLAVEGLAGRLHLSGGRAQAAEDDASGVQAGGNPFDVASLDDGDDGFAAAFFDDAASEGNTAAGSGQGGLPLIGLAGLDSHGAFAGTSLQAQFGLLQPSSGGGGGGGSGGIGGHLFPGGTGIGGGGGSGTGVEPYIPNLAFFEGFNPFAEKLGFTSFHDIAGLLPDGAKGLATAGLNVSDNPLAPVQIWQALGGFSSSGFKHSDGFNTEYTVQANGFTEKAFDHMQAAHSVNNGILAQAGDEHTKSLANSAQLIDGQDWQGALVVKGNYFEFNTVVQLNVIWNNDTVTLLHMGADGGPGPHLVNTGDNGQFNYAQILEYANSGLGGDQFLPHTLMPHQIYAGGFDKHNGVVQSNVIIQDDTYDFVINDKVIGNTQDAKFAGFADLNPGGHIQDNKSIIATGSQDDNIYGATYSLSDFLEAMQQQKTKVKVVNGDQYEFNTIFQINLISDNNTIAKTYGGGASGGGQDIIASGGNIQLNFASLEKQDSSDYLFVAGKYTQYNLVLQINALENNSQIQQMSQVLHDAGNLLEGLGGALAGSPNHTSEGGNGQNGGTQTIGLPSTLAGLNIGGMAVDTTL